MASVMNRGIAMPDVKLSMQFGSSQFAAEGPEDFINAMLEKWAELASNNAIPAASAQASSASHSIDPQSNSPDPQIQFENVFDQVDGALKIIAHIPGTNKAAKTRNTALALLYGQHLRGEATTTADSIRDACIDQGCYDSSNFASHLKGLKEKVAMNTKAGGGYDVKLTAPGRKAAKEFVEQLNNGLA